jgi:multicomponent Na+:H+ antiporter subunit F
LQFIPGLGKEDGRMTFGPTELFLVAIVALAIGILLAALRLFLGPTSPDRVVALDTINTMVVGLMIALSVYYEQVVFAGIAVVYAFLSFGATLFIARYLEQSKESEGGN